MVDNLKDIWNSQSASEIQFTETDIYKMIHKKSASIVKWIFYISIIEFVIFVLPLLFLDSSAEEKQYGLTNFTRILSVVNYGILMPVFMVLFYKNYKAICVFDSTKQLMKDILKTKKTVTYYVFFQLLLFLISVVGVVYKIMHSKLFLDQIPEDKNMMIIYVILFFIVLILFGIAALFYRLLYGILLKRLNNNYKELIKAE